MTNPFKYIIITTINVLLLCFGNLAYCYSLDDYMADVTAKNDSYQGAKVQELAFKGQKDILNLQYTTRFFANTSYLSDQRQTNSPLFQGVKTNVTSFSSGLQKITFFGTDVKLYYSQAKTSISGVDTKFFADPSFYFNSVNLELTQHLWKDFFGKQTLAKQLVKVSQVMSYLYEGTFKQKQTIASAKKIYYELAATLQKIEEQKKAIEIADSTSASIQAKINLGLGESADLYQIQSFAQTRKYELEQSLTQITKLAIDFNSLKGLNSADLGEQQLSLPSVDYILGYDITSLNLDPNRDDVKQKEEQMKIAKNNFESSRLDLMPDLDLKVTASSTGRNANYNPAMTNIWGTNYPVMSVSLNFSTAIDPFLIGKLKAGYKMAQRSTELTYSQSLMDSIASLEKLKKQFEMGKSLLKQINDITQINLKRTKEEQLRYKRGKTNLYQLCLIEQEYLLSKINLINLQMQMLQILAELETFAK